MKIFLDYPPESAVGWAMLKLGNGLNCYNFFGSGLGFYLDSLPLSLSLSHKGRGGYNTSARSTYNHLNLFFTSDPLAEERG
jgi:hypothetical protein